MTGGAVTGRVVRVSGPLVEAQDLPAVGMAEVVLIGPQAIPAEVVEVRASEVTLQAYEYTGGIRPGMPAQPQGLPLSARLGPGLLGGVFDGLLRPLSEAPVWLEPGRQSPAAGRRWPFTPAVIAGESVVAGGTLGTVKVSGGLVHRVLVEPGGGGAVEWISAEAELADDDVVARIGGRDAYLWSTWPVRSPRPVRQRLLAGAPLVTGQRVIDALCPVLRGSSAAVPGGFGTGKTLLLQQIAKWCDADVIVYVGCGERGNEMADVVDELTRLRDPRTGGLLSDRTVILANTSNMPMMAREASIYTGVTVAEYFRDMGLDVVVIADSTSRWAEALREFASRSGALPAEEGYPADLAAALAAFYERAGLVQTLGGRTGSISIIGAVSPPGSDMTEPVTAHTQRFVRAVWSLDRELAYSRHYPAVGWSASFSRDVEAAGHWYADQGDDRWSDRRATVTRTLAEADRIAAVAELVGSTALPGEERVRLLAGRLLREAVLQQSALSANDGFCSARKGAALIEAVMAIVQRSEDVVRAGVPPDAVEAVDFTPLLRAREEVGPDDVAGVAARRDTVLARLDALRASPDGSAGDDAAGEDAAGDTAELA